MFRVNTMRIRRTWHHFVTALTADVSLLRGVILYEDGPAGMVARDSFTQAFPELTRHDGDSLIMWKFDMLGFPALLTSAVRDIRRSDVIYVAASGGDAFPVAVKTCLERGLAEVTDHPRALVAELDSVVQVMTDGELPAIQYLKALAQQVQVEFFLECGARLSEPDQKVPVGPGPERVLPRAGCR